MKIDELIPGDWVRIIDEDGCLTYFFSGKVEAIDMLENIYVKAPGDETAYPYSVDCAEPISLTPEILEKNGWYKSHYGYGRDCMRLDGNENKLPDGAENAFSSALWSIDKDYQYHHLEFFMWKGHTMTTVHYVHELQHVFRLHNTNLEIKLL